jgi:glycosyltransferase involved in cell wall biosynthesis
MRISPKIQIAYLFRKPQPQYHSIERVFNRIIQFLPDSMETKKIVLKNGDKGFWSRIKALMEVMRNRGSHINHITGDITYTAVALPHKGLVVTFHDLESLDRGDNLRTRILRHLWVVIPARRAQYITVISEHTRRQVMAWAGVDESKIKVIHNPLPAGFTFTERSFDAENPNILCIGTKRNKNLEGIIEAVRGRRCSLTIAGRLTDAQRGKLKEYNIDYTNLVGVDDQTIIAAYTGCDILCFPSFYEGFGMPIIEAQTTGRVVITSDRGAMKEIAGAGALLVNPDSTADIARGIEQIIGNQQLRDELIEKGRQNALRFDAQKIADSYAELYRQMME